MVLERLVAQFVLTVIVVSSLVLNKKFLDENLQDIRGKKTLHPVKRIMDDGFAGLKNDLIASIAFFGLVFFIIIPYFVAIYRGLEYTLLSGFFAIIFIDYISLSYMLISRVRLYKIVLNVASIFCILVLVLFLFVP